MPPFDMFMISTSLKETPESVYFRYVPLGRFENSNVKSGHGR
jgi:hypothetical protein